MKVLLDITKWMLYISMIIIPTLVTPTLEYETVTWKLDFGTSSTPYVTLLSSFRNKLKATEVCKFPVTSKTPATAKEFTLVDIEDTKRRTITLAFLTSDVYFVGYRDIYNNKPRANFVSEKFKDLQNSNLFSNVAQKDRKALPFSSTYANMEKTAGLGNDGRKKLPLGIGKLDDLFDKVYGKGYGKDTPKEKDIDKNLAKFGLTVVQMVAEAARFSFIEKKVKNEGLAKNSFNPDDDMVALQKEWGKISQAIHISSKSTDPKVRCITVKSLDFPSNVDTVEGLRDYISLVKFIKGGVSEPMIGKLGANSTVIDVMEMMEPALM